MCSQGLGWKAEFLGAGTGIMVERKPVDRSVVEAGLCSLLDLEFRPFQIYLQIQKPTQLSPDIPKISVPAPTAPNNDDTAT